jgi:hypothetical protein
MLNFKKLSTEAVGPAGVAETTTPIYHQANVFDTVTVPLLLVYVSGDV